jgi:hypothetical protein
MDPTELGSNRKVVIKERSAKGFYKNPPVPWIRDGKKSGSGVNIPDHFPELRNSAKNT